MVSFSYEKIDSNASMVKDGIGRRLLLCRKDREYNVGEEQKFIIPLSRTIVAASTYMSWLCRLEECRQGTIDCCMGVLGAQEVLWVLQDIKARINSKKLIPIDSMHHLALLNPSIVFTYAFPRDSPRIPYLLKKIGIPYAVVDEWYESDILKRIEWLNFIALFIDRKQESEFVLDRVREIYSQYKHTASSSPNVLWLCDVKGQVYITGGESYVGGSIRHFGGKTLTPDEHAKGSLPSTRDWVAEKATEADIIVFTRILPTANYILTLFPELKESPAFKNREVYGFGLGYWQFGSGWPEKWISELASILAHKNDKELQVFSRARF
ncbi:MAG: hypothetical protein QXQ39_00530 [Conexivisphaerales archaeon]